MLKHYDSLFVETTHEELGQTGVFLASDGGAAITGQVIYVDGGHQIIWHVIGNVVTVVF